MKWHCLRMRCPGCHVNCLTTDVSFREDRQILLEGVCPVCKSELHLIRSIQEVFPSDHPPPVNLETWEPKGKPS